MPKTLSFLAPSLHPNTLVDLSFSEPGPSSREPIVRHLAVKHGEHQPLGLAKRMLLTGDDELVVVDDSFRISTLSFGSSDAPVPPEIISQHTVRGRTGDTWTGLIQTSAGPIASLSSGALTLLPTNSTDPINRNVPSPLLTLASSSSTATDFALAGKEVEVSVWDIERTFTGGQAEGKAGKRKKDILEVGEVWRARNLPNNHLSLRQPIYHLCMDYLPNSTNDIVIGTKAGTVRRYDTRQRKPVSDWKIAREGGIGAIQPGVEHELFFADRSSFLGSLDLRTGKLLYTYPKSTSTSHHLLSIPPSSSPTNPNLGLATISSDATFRVYSTTPPPEVAGKGNTGTRGLKGDVVGMVGGVGLGGFVFRGWGEEEGEVRVTGEKKVRRKGGDDEDDDEEESDEEVWEGMGEIGDDDEDEEEEEEDDENEVPIKRSKK